MNFNITGKAIKAVIVKICKGILYVLTEVQ